MNLVSLTIPESAEELPGWLEAQLLGPDLGALVAELAAVHGGDGTTPKSLAEILGTHQAGIIKRGLANVPRPVIKELLRHPGYLLELQELVLVEGGDYWTRRLTQSLTTAPIQSPSRSAPTAHRPEPKRINTIFMMVLTAAAAVAVTIAVDPGKYFREKPATIPTSIARGWAKPDAFQNDVDAPAYLRKIATNSEDYLSKGQESPESLATRIAEFRSGCSRLLLAEHSQLTAEAREDLRKRCRNWANKLDLFLAALEKDPTQSSRISTEVDQLARTLATTLRGQAEKLS